MINYYFLLPFAALEDKVFKMGPTIFERAGLFMEVNNFISELYKYV